MIRRAGVDDAELVNACIARDFPGVDFTEILSEPLHVCLIEDGSGAVFLFRGPGIYELHVFFKVKGRAAIELSHRMLDVARQDHGGRFFWALIPTESRKVRLFTTWMGWLSQGVLQTKNGPNELFISEKMECLQQ